MPRPGASRQGSDGDREGKGHSLKDIAAVGGWKTTQVRSDVYQMADRDTMEQVAVGAKPVTRRAQ